MITRNYNPEESVSQLTEIYVGLHKNKRTKITTRDGHNRWETELHYPEMPVVWETRLRKKDQSFSFPKKWNNFTIDSALTFLTMTFD